jgi:peptidyl-prolyl cis-trans isomerase B (cyclophilin B)
MIQAGDPSTAVSPRSQKDSINLNYTVPAEFVPGLFHKKGALAAARMGDDVNPEQASSSTQFYLVQGKVYREDEFVQVEERVNNMRKRSMFFKNINDEKEKAFEKDEPLDYGKIQQAATLRTEEQLKEYVPYKIPADYREVYKTVGGIPHLDGSYTVFGEVVEGLDVVDRIASVETDKVDRPIEDIIIKMKIVRR